jgi:hypothetical protein
VVNGVGKTTVLYATGRGLARTIDAADGTRTTPPELIERDIRNNSLTSNLHPDMDVGGTSVQVVEDWTRSGGSAARPGGLPPKWTCMQRMCAAAAAARRLSGRPKLPRIAQEVRDSSRQRLRSVERDARE